MTHSASTVSNGVANSARSANGADNAQQLAEVDAEIAEWKAMDAKTRRGLAAKDLTGYQIGLNAAAKGRTTVCAVGIVKDNLDSVCCGAEHGGAWLKDLRFFENEVAAWQAFDKTKGRIASNTVKGKEAKTTVGVGMWRVPLSAWLDTVAQFGIKSLAEDTLWGVLQDFDLNGMAEADEDATEGSVMAWIGNGHYDCHYCGSDYIGTPAQWSEEHSCTFKVPCEYAG